ncbi:MAG TPA: hypothetical protein PLV92_28155, partial [Pirellulaceae bacterium]|nr:hypothetical protein [Pirellulaceae bacterium]
MPAVSHARFGEIMARDKLAVHESPLRLAGAVFLDRGAERDRESVVEFAGNRPTFSDRAEDVVHFKETNLGYYSRIFYAPSASFHAAMAGVRARKPYRDLADLICGSLGQFNGVHVRLNDFRKFLPYRGMDYPREVLRNLAANFPAGDLLVISTDESDNAEFFAPIVSRFRNHVFVDDLIAGDFAGPFRALPFSDEVVIAWMSNLVLRGASEFLGTPGSTFSGLIHRHVAMAQAKRDLFASPQPFKFTYPGAATIDVPFEDGIFLETRPGKYSWDRLGWNMEEETKTWYREWPEAIPPVVPVEPRVAASAKPAARPMSLFTSFTGPGVPPQLMPAPRVPETRGAIERQLQTIACDLMLGADRETMIKRVM